MGRKFHFFLKNHMGSKCHTRSFLEKKREQVILLFVFHSIIDLMYWPITAESRAGASCTVITGVQTSPSSKSGIWLIWARTWHLEIPKVRGTCLIWILLYFLLTKFSKDFEISHLDLSKIHSPSLGLEYLKGTFEPLCKVESTSMVSAVLDEKCIMSVSWVHYWFFWSKSYKYSHVYYVWLYIDIFWLVIAFIILNG